MFKNKAQTVTSEALSGPHGQASPLHVLAAGAVRQAVSVTIAYFVVYYLFIFAQANMKNKLRAHYLSQGKKFERYFTRDKKLLAWDRTVGNMHEQSAPFLTLFWLNIVLTAWASTACWQTVGAGWAYVALRSVYPVQKVMKLDHWLSSTAVYVNLLLFHQIVWFGGGGNTSGTTRVMWRITIPMYVIILFLAVKAAITVYSPTWMQR